MNKNIIILTDGILITDNINPLQRKETRMWYISNNAIPTGQQDLVHWILLATLAAASNNAIPTRVHYLSSI